MLFQLLDRAKAKITALVPSDESRAFAAQIRNANPNFLYDLKVPLESHSKEEEIINAFAVLQVAIINTMGKLIVDPMVEGLRSSRTPAAIRFAIASSLAYFVQPRDYLPDDLPGGYGYMDDQIILRAAHMEYMKLIGVDDAKLEGHNSLLNLSLACLSPKLQSILKERINGLSQGIQSAQFLPQEILEPLVQVCISNPLEVIEREMNPAPPVQSWNPAYSFPTKPTTWETDGYGNLYSAGACVKNGEVFIF